MSAGVAVAVSPTVKGVSEAEVNKIVLRHQREMIAELAQVVEKGQR